MYNGWYNFYKDGGMVLLIDIGEDQSSAAGATPAYAQSYLQSHGYSPGVIAAADPNWQAITSVISHPGTIGLPYTVLLDGGMNFVLEDGDANSILQKLQELTGLGSPPVTCEGSCGGASASGCYCNDACVEYGDCCPDACEQCGVDC